MLKEICRHTRYTTVPVHATSNFILADLGSTIASMIAPDHGNTHSCLSVARAKYGRRTSGGVACKFTHTTENKLAYVAGAGGTHVPGMIPPEVLAVAPFDSTTASILVHPRTIPTFITTTNVICPFKVCAANERRWLVYSSA